MPRKIRQLKADLRKAGAYQTSQRGSHTKWKHPLIGAKVVILSGHDGDDVNFYQEQDVRTFLQAIAKAKRGGKL